MIKESDMTEQEKSLLAHVKTQAGKVDFLTKSEFMDYATALYTAVMWGKEIDQENKTIRMKERVA